MGYRENYQAWLRDFAADAQAVAELKAIEGDEKEIEDRFYRNLSFGTAGMRGVLAMGMNRMNVYTVRRATQGLADFLSADEESKRRGVVIAYDSQLLAVQHLRASADMARSIIPPIQELPLPQAIMELLDKVYDFVERHRDRDLMRIGKDGVIDADERPVFDQIVETELGGIIEAAMAVRYSKFEALAEGAGK